MELIRGLQNINSSHHGCVLTIGKFDGVHLGHQAVLRQVIEKAKELEVPATVMVFEPQPEELFTPDVAPARLSRLREKFALLSEFGVDRLICVKFNRDFAAQAPEFFIEHILVKQLGVRYLVVGDDFRFGKNRAGDFAMLSEAGNHFGFEVVDTASLKLKDNRISSTAIRDALRDADLEKASAYLGRPFSISGTVVHGAKRGRSIGFPTANVLLHRCNSPVNGVFAVVVKILPDRITRFDNHNTVMKHHGVANIGNRPTVNGVQPQLEVHIFDFNDSLYGKNIIVELHHKLRDEIKFDSFELLKIQIEKDAQDALSWLQEHHPLNNNV